jgi:16S rRNA (cytosine1402-N4)-methyltransferase
MHVSIMVRETLEYLAIRPDGVYLEMTAGLGGHTRAIAERLTTGTLIACDRDAESLEQARRNTADLASRIRFHQAAFADVRQTLASAGVERVNGLFADLGVSRYQLTDPQRGFSLMADGPLDMRMDRSGGTTAADLVNTISEKELADLIFRLGEDRRSRRLSRAIVRARPIHTTAQLARVVEESVPRTSRLHPATQTFMALRLAVNGELEQLDRLLAELPAIVAPGGRIVFISFMSLEDRRIKASFQDMARRGRAVILTKHVVRPSAAEVEANPSSRSAKMRTAEMK